MTPASSLEPPVYVELSGPGIHHVLEVGAADDRAFVVGSSRQADVHIDRPGVLAVEFHVELQAGEIWLVPAYRGRGLRVNGVPMTASVRVDRRLVVELGSLALEINRLADVSAVGATTRSNGAPLSLPRDYTEHIPSDEESTSLAMKPIEPDPFQSVTTRQVGVVTQVGPLVTLQQTERIAPLHPVPLLGLQQTERMAPVVVPARAAESSMFQTQRIPLVSAPAVSPPPAATVASFEIRQVGRSTLSVGNLQLAAQETTAFDVSAVAAPPIAPGREELLSMSSPNADRRVLEASKGRSSAVHRFLVHLGQLAKARPSLVLGGGLVGSLFAALALVGAARLVTPTSVSHEHSALVPSATAVPVKVAVPASAPKGSLPPVVAVVPAPLEPQRLARRSSEPTDVELSAAVSHLSAGRFADASRAYGSLATRTDGQVYGAASALLARRASKECTENSQQLRCPEILK